MPTLNELRVGQAGNVETLQGDAVLVQRLYEMGVLEGDRVEVLGFAPLGDPVEILIGNTRLSLRGREAASIHVRLD